MKENAVLVDGYYNKFMAKPLRGKIKDEFFDLIYELVYNIDKLDLSEYFQKLAERFSYVFDLTGCVILVNDKLRKNWVAKAYHPKGLITDLASKIIGIDPEKFVIPEESILNLEAYREALKGEVFISKNFEDFLKSVFPLEKVRRIVKSFNLKTFVGFMIFDSKNEPIASLVGASRREIFPNYFKTHLEVIQPFLNNFVEIVIKREEENKRIEHKSYLERAFNSIIAELDKFQDTRGKLDFITSNTARIIGIDRVNIWRLFPGKNVLFCVSSYEKKGEKTLGTEIPLDSYPVYSKTLTQSRVLNVKNVYEDPATSELSDIYWIPNRVISTLDVPIYVEGSHVGVICFEHCGEKERVFTDDEVNFALSVAYLVSQIFLEELRDEKEKFIEVQFKIVELLTERGSWRDNIEKVLKILGETTDVDRVYIYERMEEPEKGEYLILSYEWCSSYAMPIITDSSLRVVYFQQKPFKNWADSIIKGEFIVWKSGDPIDEDLYEYLSFQDIKSILLIPVFAKGEPWGLIGFDQTRHPREWKEHEISMLLYTSRILGKIVESEKDFAERIKAELMYKNLVEKAIVGFYRTTKEGKFVYVNQVLAKLLGYESPEELIETVNDIAREIYIKPEIRREFIRNAESKGYVLDFEAQVRRRDGKLIWVSENAWVVRDTKGNIEFYEGTVMDISYKKRIEQETRSLLDFMTGLDSLRTREQVFRRFCECFESVVSFDFAIFTLHEPYLKYELNKSGVDLAKIEETVFEVYNIQKNRYQIKVNGENVEVLVSPLVLEDQKKGYIMVGKLNEEFSLGDGELMDIFAGIVSRTLSKLNYEEEIKTNVEIMAKVNEFMLGLSRISQREEIIAKTLSFTEEMFKEGYVLIMLRDKRGKLQVFSNHDVCQKIIKLIEEQDILDEFLGNLKPVIIEDVGSFSQMPEEIYGIITREGVKSLGVFPIVEKGKIFGALVIFYFTFHKFKSWESYLVNILASFLGVTLMDVENAMKLMDDVKFLDLLQDVVKGIHEKTDFESIIRFVLKKLEENLNLVFSLFYTCDPEKGKIRIKMLGEGSKRFTTLFGLKEGDEVSGEFFAPMDILENREISYFPDTTKFEGIFCKFAEVGFHSMMVVPRCVEGSIYGGILLAKDIVDGFSSREGEFLARLASQLSIAIYQTKLIEDLRNSFVELEYLQSRIMDEEKIRALGRMASGIAHDINNLLVPIQGYSEILLNHPDEEVRKIANEIFNSARHIAGVVQRMREFYRKRTDEDIFESVDLNHCIKEALNITKPHWWDSVRAMGKEILVELHLQESLPLISGVESDIRQALINVIINAVDAMPDGGKLILRSYTEERQNRLWAVAEVEDTGIGMDEETKRWAIEPFFTTKDKGSGLGLSIVYGILKRHEGSLEIISEKGKGTLVRLIFPITKIKQVSLERYEVIPLKILVIDDEPFVRETVARLLEMEGHIVRRAESGEEGLEILKRAYSIGDKIELVITDLGMPRMDGLQVAKAVKAFYPNLPVILLTGWGFRFDSPQAYPDIDEFVSKPPTSEQLRKAISRAIKKYQENQDKKS